MKQEWAGQGGRLEIVPECPLHLLLPSFCELCTMGSHLMQHQCLRVRAFQSMELTGKLLRDRF